jgi:hypothetical protein
VKAAACPTCGRPLDEHDRHIRFTLPDPVLEVPDSERTWQAPDMMQVDGVGSFLRALLPVRLTGGYRVTFGVWLLVHPDDLQRAFRVWQEPDFVGFSVDGWLGNAVRPWGLLGKPVHAQVRDPDQIPYIDTSTDPLVARVLAEEWPHEDILAVLRWRCA